MSNKLYIAHVLLFFSLHSYAFDITITPTQKQAIAHKIWHNESRNSVEKLTWWKQGEEFASMGIGHFIWFPSTYNGPFVETFPALIQFLTQKGIEVPDWLTHNTKCPWPTREAFFNAFNGTSMQHLRTLLATTTTLQAEFIIERFLCTVPRIFSAAPAEKQAHVTAQFQRIAQTPTGLYALIDYVNFKGDGTNPRERYNGKGWGLLQVLERMRGTASNDNPLEEFAAVAQQLLTERVQNADPQRNEHQWLQGWKNRINTYTQTS